MVFSWPQAKKSLFCGLLQFANLLIDNTGSGLSKSHNLVSFKIGQICASGFSGHIDSKICCFEGLSHTSGGPCLNLYYFLFPI